MSQADTDSTFVRKQYRELDVGRQVGFFYRALADERIAITDASYQEPIEAGSPTIGSSFKSHSRRHSRWVAIWR